MQGAGRRFDPDILQLVEESIVLEMMPVSRRQLRKYREFFEKLKSEKRSASVREHVRVE